MTVPGFKEKDPKTFASFQNVSRQLVIDAEQRGLCPWNSEDIGAAFEKLGVFAPLCSAEALSAQDLSAQALSDSKVSTRATPGCGNYCYDG